MRLSSFRSYGPSSLAGGALALVATLSLLPAGIYQAWASVDKGMWFARSPEIVHSAVMETLPYLVSYPYGCVEQTTSKAFPQLFIDGELVGVEVDAPGKLAAFARLDEECAAASRSNS